jgi:hypothetical protein
MVWMPYTVPAPVGASGYGAQPPAMMTVYLPAWVYGSAPQFSGQIGQPQGAYPQVAYPAALYPSGAYPAAVPQASSPQPIPQVPYGQVGAIPGSPQSMAQAPYGQAAIPQLYGSGGTVLYGNAISGSALPAQPGVQPYALATPIMPQTPLAVPTLPGGPNGGNQPVPLPPISPSSLPAQPTLPQASAPLYPGTAPLQSPEPGTAAIPATVPTTTSATPLPESATVNPNRRITEPNLNLQGLYVLQGDNSSARARLSGEAFLTPHLLIGGALDLVTGPDLTNDDGVDLTELYLATAVPGAPGLRFRLGQLDLTSYFDRNSFAKDIGRDFFNSTFHTNPALISGANATASRPAGLVQWAVTDDIALNAAVFSSSSDITDFALDGFAGEVGFRTGNFIVRGTFLTARDSEFQGSGGRLDSYGVNAEWFIPEANIGLFGRYGHLNNDGTGFSGDTYSFGVNALDIFMENDRLGLGYGRNLETTVAAGETPDVLELFYDFEVIPNLRLGFTFQQRNNLQESYAGFRVRGDLDLLPQSLAE